MPTLIEKRLAGCVRGVVRYSAKCSATRLIGCALIGLAGCGEPSVREYKNRGELEAILAAVSLRNSKELARDARRIGDRHASGELSDAFHKELSDIVELAQQGNWARAEKRAYELREQTPFFK